MKRTTEIEKILIEALQEVCPSLEITLPTAIDSDTALYGNAGFLSSVALVTLIVTVEEKIEDRFETTLVLASEKALSYRSSPFRSVGTLVAYVESLLSAEVEHA